MAHRKGLKKCAALFMAAACMVTMVSSPAYAIGEGTFTVETVNGSAVSGDSRVQEAKKKKEELQNKLDGVNATIKKAQSDKSQAANAKKAWEEQKSIITEQIETLVTTITEAEAAVCAKEQEIRQTEKKIEKKTAEIEDQWDTFKDQMAAMQKLNDTGFVSILANCKSLYQLLTFNKTMQEVSQQDTDILDRMKAQKEELNEEKEKLEIQHQELEEAKEELENEKAELDSKSEELAASISGANATISAAEATEQAQKAVAEATQKEIQQAEVEYENAVRAALAAAQSNNTGGRGDFTSDLFTWPLPGYTKITTYFGQNDAYGRAGHKGIDISGQYQTPPIHAAAGGTVTVATYSSSYGNYVVVYHGQDEKGNGYATLYAHMSSIAVSSGQSVSVGQTLGYVGNTGWSTGLHLHFEVRINGNPTNPFNYFS